MTAACLLSKFSGNHSVRWPTQTNQKTRPFALNCRLSLYRSLSAQIQNRARPCESNWPRQSPDKLPLQPPAEPSPDSKSTAQVLTSPEVFSSPSASPAFSADPLPVAQAPVPGGFSSSPKKETARIPRMPDPPSKPLPTVQMKKTQPLIAMPHAAPQRASIAMAPAEKSVMPLCWVLLGVSAIILIIQIWTYFS